MLARYLSSSGISALARSQKEESGFVIASRAAAFSKKIECFCFTPQTLAAGERRRMPVLFVLDRAMDQEVHTVTLSYTFFEMGAKAQTTGRLRVSPHG